MRNFLILVVAALFIVTCRRTALDPDPGVAQNKLVAALNVAEKETRLVPEADAFVRNGNFSESNFGKDTSLLVKGTKVMGYKRNSYLKFSLAGLGAITRATLRVYGACTEPDAAVHVQVCAGDNNKWSEEDINHENRPGHEESLTETTVTSEAKYYEWDVTSAVQQAALNDSVVSLILRDSLKANEVVLFNSREHPANQPELVLYTEVEEEVVVRDKPAHQFFVWLENKSFDEIIGNPKAPYLNYLASIGTLFDSVYPIPNLNSYPQYIAWFGGDQNGVASNACLDRAFTTNNLYTNLSQFGKTFCWYSEDLPFEGSDTCAAADGLYREKHQPTTAWVLAQAPAAINKPFSAVNWQDTSVFRTLPNVVCITPNMDNNMHDGPIKRGDAWVKDNLGKLVDWCMQKENNAEFYIYYDEEGEGDPRIPVTVVGAHIKQGFRSPVHYPDGHYSFGKLVATSFNADTTGAYFSEKVFAAKNVTEHRIGF